MLSNQSIQGRPYGAIAREQAPAKAADQQHNDVLIVCLPQLLAAQATTTPDAPALIMHDRVLSYSELNRRANQLAHYLRTLGVGPNVLVGICIERSIDLIIGMLGILKAGGAYVPLDSSYPVERLSFMLEDAHVPVLVTFHSNATRLSVGNLHFVCLDADEAVIARESTEQR